MFEGSIAAYVVAMALLTLTPGADTALVTRSAIVHGRRSALWTVLGINSGLIVHATASAAGLAAVIASSATAFNVMKWVGAGYLVLLGVWTWRSSFAHVAAEAEEAPAAERAPRARVAYLQGLASNVFNPKLPVFYLSFLPQFVDPDGPVLLASLLLAGIHIALGLSWLAAYATMVARAGDVLRRPRARRAIERITGTALIGLGARLALERR